MKTLGYVALVLVAACLGGASYALLQSSSQQQVEFSNELEEKQQKIAALNEQLELLSTELMFEQLMSEAHQLSYQRQLEGLAQKLEQEYQQQIASLSQQLSEEEARSQSLKSKLLASEKSAKNYRYQYFALKKTSDKQEQALLQKYQAKQQLLEAESSLEIQKQRARLEQQYSETAKLTQVEQRVDELMTSFSKLRVDMDIVNTCDQNYLDRYSDAKSLLSQMRTFVHNNEMSNEYYQFVISNDAQISRKTREICLEN
ncbi:hypothetical protein [Vibrio sp. LaRot3]|uniref:hypothetical protein n=1 Tax=Vibrio sp. LaRot3 TaxID=2998829 RepID=UPI0022CE34C5|nr:hypothetical protein [Vibrio sp. LaRot3]MDA0148129.1 hypothetical protein [Vibrio sp. LaRot3]